MKYKEYWLYYFEPTNMLFAFKEIQQIKRQHPENFKETHVIEYQAYEKLQKQNEKLKDALNLITKVTHGHKTIAEETLKEIENDPAS